MQHIKKIDIFDFDNTLCISPENTLENRVIWESVKGRKWPYSGQGWWSKDETLDPDVFDIKLNPLVLKSVMDSVNDSSIYTVLLTGRMPKFSASIKEICRRHGMSYLDAYFFNDSHNTLEFKLRKMQFLKEEFPFATKMEMWEDRIEHITHFNEWGVVNYGNDFIMNLIKI